MNRLREDKRNLTIFNWIDTKEKRDDKGELIIVLNDENSIDDNDVIAFKQYDISTIPFSKRNDYLNLFEAS
jgi:hypothetical protein